MEDYETNDMEKTSAQDYIDEIVECNEEIQQEIREGVQNPIDDQLNILPEQLTITPQITNFLGK